MTITKYFDGNEEFKVISNENIIIGSFLRKEMDLYEEKPTIYIYNFGFDIRYKQYESEIVYRINYK